MVPTLRLCLILSLTCAATLAVAATDQHGILESSYEAHEWFQLRDAVQASDASAFYRGAVAAAFNDTAKAESYLGSVVKASPLSKQASEARLLMIQLYLRSGRYRQALKEVESALKTNPHDSGLENVYAPLEVLGQLPEQSVTKRELSSVRYSMHGGNLFLPIEVNGKAASYIIDTGANFSLISEAEARRVGLNIRESPGATMGDASGAQVGFRIAVADRFTAGNIELSNVAFLVVRDDQQPFVELPLGKRAVLGIPVLLGFQTMRWNRDGVFEIGIAAGEERFGEPNLFFEGQNAIAQAEFGQSKINVFLDTGATRTRMLPRFATQFAGVIAETGKKSSQRITGVGGSVEVESVTLPEVKLRIRGPEVRSSPATVLLQDTVSDLKRCHAWLGMDLLNQARAVTLDFESMTLSLE